MEQYAGEKENRILQLDQFSNNKFSQAHPYQCRICLVSSPSLELDSDLISPCKCTGSLKYIHEICLQKWVSRIVNESDKKIKTGKAHIHCELCKQKIFFKTAKKLKCKEKSKIGKDFKQNIKSFVLLCLLFLINLGFVSALLNYLLFVGFTTLKSNNAVLVSLVIAGMVIFSIVAVVTLLVIVNKYFLVKKIIVMDLNSMNTNNLNLSTQSKEQKKDERSRNESDSIKQ